MNQSSAPLKLLIGLILAAAAVFGYFLVKTGGDVTLARAVMMYEIKQLLDRGDSDQPIDPVNNTESPSGVPASDDQMYRDGNRFSDYKKTGSDEAVSTP